MSSEAPSSRTSRWIKAGRSTANNDCVEMRRTGSAVQVRDSKNPDGDVLSVTPAQFRAWVAGAERGSFAAELV